MFPPREQEQEQEQVEYIHERIADICYGCGDLVKEMGKRILSLKPQTKEEEEQILKKVLFYINGYKKLLGIK